MALIVTSFALAGSRVSLTGGIYAYVEVAFGPFVGFLAGVLQWLMLWLTAGGLLSAFADQVGLLGRPGRRPGRSRAPRSSSPPWRCLAFVNVRGVAIGARRRRGRGGGQAAAPRRLPRGRRLLIQPAALAWPGWPAGREARRDGAAPDLRVRRDRGGARAERRGARPRARTVPRAIYLALGAHDAPLPRHPGGGPGRPGRGDGRSTPRPRSPRPPPASSAAGGRLLVLAGGAVSMFGYLCGDMLSSPRSLYAFGRDGFLPRALARVHPSLPHAARGDRHPRGARRRARGQQQLPLPGAPRPTSRVLTLYFLCCAAALRLVSRPAAPGEAARLRLPGERVDPGGRHGRHRVDPGPRHAPGARGPRRDARRGHAALRVAPDPDAVKVHLVDGTYELFRAFYGAPPAHDARGREVGAAARPPRDAALAAARARRDARRVRLRPRDRVVPQRALRRLQDRRGHRPGPAARSSRWPRTRDARARRRGLADGRVRGRRRARHRGRALRGATARRAGGDLLARQGPRAVRRGDARRLPRPPAQQTLDEAGVRRASSACRPRRSRTGSRSSATAPTAIPGMPGWGAKSAAARARAATTASRRSPTSRARWDVERARRRRARGAALRERRADALLYRRLATLRTDVPLAETLDDLRVARRPTRGARGALPRSGRRTCSGRVDPLARVSATMRLPRRRDPMKHAARSPSPSPPCCSSPRAARSPPTLPPRSGSGTSWPRPPTGRCPRS